jgi:hypothetical protein
MKCGTQPSGEDDTATKKHSDSRLTSRPLQRLKIHVGDWRKLSCRRFKDNEARLQLFALAYN